MLNSLISAFIIGIVSAGHCFGMCGGLVVAAGFNSTHKSYLWLYNIGRISTYVILGALFGLTSAVLPDTAVPILKGLSVILLILTAFYFMGITSAVTSLEKAGLPIWRKIQPLTRKLLPVSSAKAALSLGLLWGFIPCGLVYTALAFAMSLGNSVNSMLAMLAFGLGTFPAMISVGLAANVVRPLLAKRSVRVGLGSVLLITALILAYSTFFNAR
ncbi:sulfite exporter TauE/SafE family protein [Reinekea sp.]|jgi:sulfite exporter TauE/SafE|uniref:sulfite exporter TauE/SafE family protein n=1 Tax=Reinekea sp. TaxID=1970455 RepID=UPI00398A2119